MENKKQKPNFLHYIGIILVFAGWFVLLQLRLAEGFSLWFIGCGIGLLGCKFDDVTSKKEEHP